MGRHGEGDAGGERRGKLLTDETWLETVRLSRDLNTLSSLFPEYRDLRDLPHPLFELIRTSLIFLSFDEMEEEERPPRRIWLDAEKLKDHMDEVKRRREEKMKGGDRDWNRDIEDPVDNAAASGLVVG